MISLIREGLLSHIFRISSYRATFDCYFWLKVAGLKSLSYQIFSKVS
jgi:hypothetical protein